jgi:hypothetical protein
MIIKDGGCDHIFCEQCHVDFIWTQAERVVPPAETSAQIPAANNVHRSQTQILATTAAAGFRGWANLREVQDEYITRHGIADIPFDIGDARPASQDEDEDEDEEEDGNIFFYYPSLGIWSPERCELDGLAAKEAGKRYIRAPDRDQDDRWAFVEVNRDEQVEGVELPDALTEAMPRGGDVWGGGGGGGGWGAPDEGLNGWVQDAPVGWGAVMEDEDEDEDEEGPSQLEMQEEITTQQNEDREQVRHIFRLLALREDFRPRGVVDRAEIDAMIQEEAPFLFR